MLGVEMVARIRRAHLVEGKSIKAIAREFDVARNTVRKVLRSGETGPRYAREVQPRPRLEAWVGTLRQLLAENERRPRRERVDMVRIYEDLRAAGYAGGYDAVRRYARTWARERGTGLEQAFVPLSFAPGEAYQFDWSQEIVVLDGVTTTVRVAQVRLCHSRMPFVRVYPREAQEMVFDAHDKAFAFFHGACQRGLYDNMRTAVDAVLIGRERVFNRRFLQMCSHHLVEPVACTPAAGWEKGQVENQVGVTRARFFRPRLRFGSYAELNGWLLDRCVSYARAHPHPEQRDSSVWSMFEGERPSLIPFSGPFDGFSARATAVSKTCLVRFDRNKYSVAAHAVGRPVDVQAYADRVVIRQNGEVVGEHARSFGHGQTIYDPWHYVPVLARKPGALRNGAPFRDWVLPGALGRVRQKLRGVPDGDRQMVDILSAAVTDGLPAVEAACAAALAAGTYSADVVLNTLSRRRATPSPGSIVAPERLGLAHPPLADCARYDTLRRRNHGAT